MSEFDVYDPGIYAEGVPHEAFRRMRAEAPIYWHAEPDGGRGYWALTKYADLIAVSKNPTLFSSARGATFIKDANDMDLPVLQTFMLNMDPPQHIRFRNLVKHAFVPKSLPALEPRIKKMVRQIIDKVAPVGQCDFVNDIAAQLPLQVIAEMIGVPDGDRDMVFEWSNKMTAFDDPELHQNEGDSSQQAAMEMYQYAGELGQQRVDNPGDDLISMLMKGVADGGLSAMEFASFFMLLFVAGNETTRNATSGGMIALLENPEQRARLVADPSLIPTAVEEILRWVSPLIYFRRTATKDCEIRGQAIKENDKVVMYYPAANRDEEVFANANSFDIGRTPNDHLAFGVGQHWCLGANLARVELRCMFEEILLRLPQLELADQPKRLRSNFLNGIKSMPVRFPPERVRAMP
ncbi:MAG: cytochrome family protein [Myxococcales bacterium]|nr:cytochrome family protein [Myxococcales bacterium]